MILKFYKGKYKNRRLIETKGVCTTPPKPEERENSIYYKTHILTFCPKDKLPCPIEDKCSQS